MQVKLKRAANAQEWAAALAQSGGVTPFHEWDWLTAQAALHGWRFEPLIARWGRTLLGAVPLLLIRRGAGWAPAPCPFPYVGPIVPDADLQATLRALRRWSAARRVVATRLDFVTAPTRPRAAALAATGCTWREPSTYVVDISHGSVDQLMAGMTAAVRKSIRIAERAGVTITDSTDAEIVELLPALIAEPFDARGLDSPYPASIGQWSVDALRDVPVVALTASVEGRPAGLLLAIGHGDVLYGWVGGAFREFRSQRVSHALHAAMFARAVDAGYRTVDTVGEVDPGVASFKASFGATPVPFTLAEQTTYPLHALVRRIARRGAAAPADVAPSNEPPVRASRPAKRPARRVTRRAKRKAGARRSR